MGFFPKDGGRKAEGFIRKPERRRSLARPRAQGGPTLKAMSPVMKEMRQNWTIWT